MASVTKIPDGGADESGDDGSKQSSGPELGAVMHEHVYERLREALISGQLAPGRSLSVRRLASEFEVSAMPAREAIRRLVAIGALEVTDTRRVSISRMTAEKLEEIKACRLFLEPLTAERALHALKGRAREKKRILRAMQQFDDLLDGAIRSGNVTDYARYNSDFHFTLYRASGASVLLGLVESLWLQFGPFMRVVIGRLGTSCLAEDRHKDVLDAFEAGDAAKLTGAVRADILHGLENIDGFDFDEQQ